MVAHPARRRWILPHSLIAGAIVALPAAAAVALLPEWRVEGLAQDSRLSVLVPASPLPMVSGARLALMLLAVMVTGGGTWLAVRRLAPPDRVPRLITRRIDDADMLIDENMPVVTAPIVEQVVEPQPVNPAAESPAPSPPVERELPGDLDMPLAAFDPGAIREKPPVQVEPVDALPVERLAPLPLPRQYDDAPITAPDTRATVHAMFKKLERGVRGPADRAASNRESSSDFDEALATLKRFAGR
ncbi:hypothetical protein [Sphingomonas sp. IW22]|uniref:hypothetical protein n=1 Tax=Sphingomonas sp. IW22 TaxID=3242489 RepID=UPI003521B648